MKIEIGPGPKPQHGYTHIDIAAGPHIENVAPAWSLPVPDGSADEIYARHVFEHFSPAEAERVLLEWKRVLKPGGTVHIILPDLSFHAKQLTMPGQSEFLPHVSNHVHAMSSIYGWQTGNPAWVHKWGYTPATLTALFERHGYRCEILPCRACDIDLLATK